MWYEHKERQWQLSWSRAYKHNNSSFTIRNHFVSSLNMLSMLLLFVVSSTLYDANVAYYYYCRLSTNDCRHGMCSSVISESNCCVNPFSFVFDGNTHPTYVRHLHNWSLRLMMFTHHTHLKPLLAHSYVVGLYIRQTINYRISTISFKRFE